MNRRTFLSLLLSLIYSPALLAQQKKGTIIKPIPATGESIPVVGMGSWLTFDVEDDEAERAQRVQVLDAFFQAGGKMIDSSPMYGSSQEVIGYCLAKLKAKSFAATKVWTLGQASGLRQIKAAQQLWGVQVFDLMQIHNLVSWRKHLPSLKSLKAQGKIRYLGITTSHGRRHEELINLLKQESFDFVQFTYNIVDREVEQYLLPLAKERGVAVIVNRPFQGGSLFSLVKNRSLPPWAKDIDCVNWAQFFLKFIVSHQAVTCAIPATSRVDHMIENMGAAYGKLPNKTMRQKMIAYITNL